jgi:hypothetical protein
LLHLLLTIGYRVACEGEAESTTEVPYGTSWTAHEDIDGYRHRANVHQSERHDRTQTFATFAFQGGVSQSGTFLVAFPEQNLGPT